MRLHRLRCVFAKLTVCSHILCENETSLFFVKQLFPHAAIPSLHNVSMVTKRFHQNTSYRLLHHHHTPHSKNLHFSITVCVTLFSMFPTYLSNVEESCQRNYYDPNLKSETGPALRCPLGFICLRQTS